MPNRSNSRSKGTIPNSSLIQFKADAELLGLTGKALIDYVESRRKEEAEREEREAREEGERDEREKIREREAEKEERERERVRQCEIEREKLKYDFELRQLQLQTESNRNTNDNANSSNSHTQVQIKDSLPRLPYLEDKDDVEHYLRQFERMAKLSQWDEADWATRLSCLCRGKAREAVIELDETEADNYEAVKTAILRKFQLTAEIYRKKFRDAQKKAEISSKDHLKSLALYLDRWIELSKREGKSDNLHDMVLLERFLDSLSADHAQFIRERNPSSIAEAEEFATLYEESRAANKRLSSSNNKGTGNENRNYHNNDRNHQTFKKYPLSQPQTSKSENMNADNNDNTKPRQKFGYTKFVKPQFKNTTQNVQCNLCGGNHFARYCTNKKHEQATIVAINFVQLLNGKEESIYSCEFNPQCTVKVAGKTVEALRDTGATSIIVDRRIVPKEAYTAERKSVTMADSSVVNERPVAIVDMETPYFKGKVRAVVLENLCYPCVIGNGWFDKDGVRRPVPIRAVMNDEQKKDAYQKVVDNVYGARNTFITKNKAEATERKQLKADLTAEKQSEYLTTPVMGQVKAKVRDVTPQVKGKTESVKQKYASTKMEKEDIPQLEGKAVNTLNEGKQLKADLSAEKQSDYLTAPVMGQVKAEERDITSQVEGKTVNVKQKYANTKIEKKKIPQFEGKAVNTPKEICAPVQTRQKGADNKTEETVKTLNTFLEGLSDIGPMQLHEEQLKDPTLQKVRELAAKKDLKGTRYVWHNNLLFRIFERNGTSLKQVVVPQKYRTGVMKAAHDTPMAGHLAQKRTRDRIWRDFYWPGIIGEVRRFCASCDACQRCTPKGATRRVPMCAVPLVSTPFEKVGIDLIGPIAPTSSRGHKYILTMVDYATRYLEAFPLKNIRAETIIEKLWEIWTRLGIPKEVVTDQGTQFMSEKMKQVQELLDIKGIRTTPYHPQSNGLTERCNATIKAMLKRLCQEQPREWDKFLPALLFAYREVPQESLKFSPFELIYGRQVRGPMQVLRQLWTEEEPSEETRTNISHFLNLANIIEQTCSLARQNLAKASGRHMRYYNAKSTDRQFNEGDQILLLLPEKHNKLQLTWRGPFTVREKKGFCNYKIDMNGKSKIYHANLMKHYITRQTDNESVAVVMNDEDIESEEHYEVSNIPTLCYEQTQTQHDVKISPDLDQEKQELLKQILEENKSCLTDVPGKTSLIECSIKTESNTPVRVKSYPIPYSKLDTVKCEVKQMLEMGVIEPSSSPYNAPIVLIKKKDGTIRFCIDFRRLNLNTEFDGEGLPDVENLFNRLSKAKYFSKLDLTKGYWQIPMKREDKQKTAFNTPLGQFQWTMMPFGLKNAGAIFTRMMRSLLEPLLRSDVHNFIDDILIASETWDEHVTSLKAVLDRLKEVNLTVKPSKCFLGFSELSFLGHQIGKGKVCPEEDKIGKIAAAVLPTTKKELRAFLGLAGYYRKFVPNFAEVSAPLTDMTKKGQPDKLKWSSKCVSSFNELKTALIKKPILALPDCNQPFVLRTDASDIGIGAVLLQERDGKLHPVHYASKKLNAAARNYSVAERECLAVVWAVKKFEPYLYGTHFTLETDHQALQFLDKCKTENGRLMRWSLCLQQYSYTTKVIPGKDNVGADYLSRSLCHSY